MNVQSHMNMLPFMPYLSYGISLQLHFSYFILFRIMYNYGLAAHFLSFTFFQTHINLRHFPDTHTQTLSCQGQTWIMSVQTQSGH